VRRQVAPQLPREQRVAEVVAVEDEEEERKGESQDRGRVEEGVEAG
jgi:hypothetical protein